MPGYSIVHEQHLCQALVDLRRPTEICLFYVRKACCEEENEPVMVNQRFINEAVLEDCNHGFNLGVTVDRKMGAGAIHQAGVSGRR